MARIGIGEIGAIEAAVSRMVSNLAGGRSALGYTSKDRQLLGVSFGTQPSGWSEGALDVREIRACYFPETRSISLTGTTWQPSVTPEEADLAEFRTWVVAALAHEVCHMMQHSLSPGMFLPGAEADRAADLSRKARCTSQPEDYVAYLECELELEAHAAQLAAELRSSDELTEDEFRRAAPATSILTHVKDRCTDAEGAVWSDWDALEGRLIDEAWRASEMMRGR